MANRKITGNLNDLLANIITMAAQSKDQQAVISVLEMLRSMMEKGKHLIVPAEWIEDAKDALDVEVKDGVQQAVLKKDTTLTLRHINGKDDEDWLVAFSSMEELRKGAPTFCVPVKVKDLMEAVKNSEVKGIVINPFGTPFMLGETLVDMIFEASKAMAEQGAAEGQQAEDADAE